MLPSIQLANTNKNLLHTLRSSRETNEMLCPHILVKGPLFIIQTVFFLKHCTDLGNQDECADRFTAAREAPPGDGRWNKPWHLGQVGGLCEGAQDTSFLVSFARYSSRQFRVTLVS